ncbi:MAG: DUF3047 domain-containing protein [Nitrospira sp.]|nr:DUF3047 domain-containing protein [bacterium]MBL7049799.1 DUF3047 domain-containing protein [Nitrospira sp.]
MNKYILSLTLLIVLFAAMNLPAENSATFFREEFDDLENWKPLHFPKIEAHTKYLIEKEVNGNVLKAESSSSASGLIFKKEFDVFEFSKVKWRWKIEHVFKTGDATSKKGDDYPIRIYIIFKYNPDKASLGKRIRYGIAKAIYGEYPPDSSLNYIWANKEHDKKYLPNTYTSAAMMRVMQSGDEGAGKWFEHEVNIIEDYHEAFKEDPPAVASLAIMSDSDNTGESSSAYIDFIEVFR